MLLIPLIRALRMGFITFRKIIVGTFLLCLAYAAQATTFYVDPDFGDDAWNGQFNSYNGGVNGPKKTIGSALSVAADLDLIQIQSSNYSECLVINKTISLTVSGGNASVRCVIMNGNNKRLILLGSDLIVTDTLRLTRGIVDATVANLVTAANCRVVGGSNLSFVEGRLHRTNTNTIVTDLFFPIGAGQDYRPMWMSFLQNTTQPNRYIGQVYNSQPPPAVIPPVFKNVSRVHFWNLRYTGTATPSKFTFRVAYDSTKNDDEVQDPARLRLGAVILGTGYFRNLGGVGSAKFKGNIESSVTVDSLGNLTLANLWNGTNTLGRLQPVARFGWSGVCERAPIQFRDSSITGKGSITRWKWNFGTGIAGDTSNLKNPVFRFPGTGPFFVTLFATNSSGNVDSTSAYVALKARPKAAMLASDACLGKSQLFDDVSTVPAPDTIKSRLWNLGDGGNRILKSFNYTYVFPSNYNVSVIVTSSSGCVDTARKVVKVFPKPNPALTVSGVCVGDTSSFAGTGGASGDTISSWKWFVNGIQESGLKSFKKALPASGSYNVLLAVESQTGCFDTARRNLTIYGAPVALAFLDPSVSGNDSIQCFRGNKFTIKTTSTAGQSQTISHSYYWNNSAVPGSNTFTSSSSGQLPLKVLAITDRGCRDSMSLIYAVRDSVSFKYTTQTFCLPAAAIFRDSSTAGSASVTSRQWSFGDGGAASGSVVSHTYSTAGNYNLKLKITTSEGCSDSVSQNIALTSTPVSVISRSAVSAICPGDTLKVSVSGGLNVLWNDGSTNRFREFTSAGRKKVRVFNTPFCFADDSTDVSVHPPVPADAGLDTSLVRGRYLILKGDGGVKYSWTPRNLVQDPDSVRTRVQPGQTTVFYLQVTDLNGCVGTDSVKVTVLEPLFIRIPNMISPNGDGKNDAWDLREVPFVDRGKVTIYNHFGQLVFEQNTGYNHTWTGTDNSGKSLPQGTYLFVIEVPTEKEPFKGFLQIMP